MTEDPLASRRDRFLTEMSPVQLWTALPDGKLDYVTDQTAARLGVAREHLLADGWQNVVHEADFPRVAERWRHALATGDTYEVEFRLKLASGEYAWHLTRAVPQRDVDGAIVRWFGMNANIETERAQQERVQSLLAEVEHQAARLRQKNQLLTLESEVASTLARPGALGDALQACVAAVVSRIDAAFARVWTMSADGTALELRASAGMYTHLDGAHGRVALGSLEIGRIAAERAPHWTNDVATDPRIGDPAWAAREAMVAFAGYPLLVDDKLVGVFAVFARHPLTPVSLTALETTAGSLAQAIERRSAEDTLRLRDAERVLLLAQEQRARRDADAARAELRSLFTQAPAPIAVLRGSSLVYELANPAYMELVGRERDILGRSLREARPDLEGTGFLEQFEAVFVTGTRFLGQRKVSFRRADGTMHDGTFDFVLAPFHGIEDQVVGVLVIAFDVSDAARARESIQATLEEREQMLETAERARRAAELASRAKDEFLATASHELRTPLNSILGWAQVLRDGAVDASKFAVGLEAIVRNAKLQTQLIEDILDGSRIITGKLHLEIREIDLTAVVNAALDTVRPAATAKGISLALALDPAAAHISGDPDRLQQVVWNLLSNAIKFTPKGGTVEIRTVRSSSHVELSVKDDGSGIPRDFVPHVFERFRQADEGATRRHGGLGLGLALVRHLVEAHGGTADAESEGEGKGALFTLRLPVLAALPTRAPTKELPTTTTTAPSRSSMGALQGLRVLIVDDEPDARALVATVLQARGADVLVASSVEQALLLLELRNPDVLVSDIGMPGTDGYMLLERVHALTTKAARTPAIALTAYASELDRSRALAAGFHAHLAKPFDAEVLVRLVGEAARPRS